MTPQETFDKLSEMFDDLSCLEKTGNRTTVYFKDGCWFVVDSDKFGSPVEWDGTTEYKPEKWRPATVADIQDVLGEEVTYRLGHLAKERVIRALVFRHCIIWHTESGVYNICEILES